MAFWSNLPNAKVLVVKWTRQYTSFIPNKNSALQSFFTDSLVLLNRHRHGHCSIKKCLSFADYWCFTTEARDPIDVVQSTFFAMFGSALISFWTLKLFVFWNKVPYSTLVFLFRTGSLAFYSLFADHWCFVTAVRDPADNARFLNLYHPLVTYLTKLKDQHSTTVSEIVHKPQNHTLLDSRVCQDSLKVRKCSITAANTGTTARNKVTIRNGSIVKLTLWPQWWIRSGNLPNDPFAIRENETLKEAVIRLGGRRGELNRDNWEHIFSFFLFLYKN